VEVDTAITSGAMVSITGYEAVGPFRSDYFIDYVDDEFCLRLRQNHYLVLSATRPLIRHPIGSSRKHPFLWGAVISTHHAALRRYYQMRNRVLTLKRYGLREPRWAIKQLRITAIELVATPIVEAEGLTKLRAMMIGLAHGLLGRTGKTRSTF
jgi:rhamnosyltransferase